MLISLIQKRHTHTKKLYKCFSWELSCFAFTFIIIVRKTLIEDSFKTGKQWYLIPKLLIVVPFYVQTVQFFAISRVMT